VKEELRMKEFETRVLRKIFGSKRDALIGGWKLLHNGELHNFYSSNIKIIKLRGIDGQGI
jgi:hypothetical protein